MLLGVSFVVFVCLFLFLAALLCVALITYMKIISREGKADEVYITLGIEACKICDSHSSHGC